MQQLHQNQFQPTTESTMKSNTVKAKCKRLANRSVVVGNTCFTFDADGICEAKPNGRASFLTDFGLLCKMTGVTRVEDAPALEPTPAPAVEVKKEEPAPAPAPEPEPEFLAADDDDYFQSASQEAEEDKSQQKRGKGKRSKKEND